MFLLFSPSVITTFIVGDICHRPDIEPELPSRISPDVQEADKIRFGRYFCVYILSYHVVPNLLVVAFVFVQEYL